MSAGFHILSDVKVRANNIHSADKPNGGTWTYDKIRLVRPYADRSLLTLFIGLAVGAAAMSAGGWGILGGLAVWALVGYITYNPRQFVKVTLTDGYELWLNVQDKAEAEDLSGKINAAMQRFEL